MKETRDKNRIQYFINGLPGTSKRKPEVGTKGDANRSVPQFYQHFLFQVFFSNCIGVDRELSQLRN